MAANANVQRRLTEFFNEPIFQICSFWGVDPADPSEVEAVKSKVPALILQGDYDAATPPAWVTLAAKTLSNAQYYEFRGIGHGVYGEGADGGKCSIGMVNAFLADPMQVIDSSCLDDMKSFFITSTAP